MAPSSDPTPTPPRTGGDFGPTRKLPLLTPDTEAFWTGGKHGTLMIQRCTHCGL